MRINEVEALVGITKKNIRFYEEKGLLSPRRSTENGYRDYGEAEVTVLRRIRRRPGSASFCGTGRCPSASWTRGAFSRRWSSWSRRARPSATPSGRTCASGMWLPSWSRWCWWR